jgi:lysophospholipase L1-like esterase
MASLPVYRRIAAAAAAAVLALLGSLTAVAAKSVSAGQHYVALGDSYASGPGIPEQRADPIGCQRSTSNYPALFAQALGVRHYTDASCGGAKTDHMTVPQPVQPGPNPPQFDALTPDTDLVTVTIGGNDIDIGGLWLTCARLGVTDPSGNPCERQATAGGTDPYAQRIAAAAPKVGRVLEGIHQRSPQATVLLVGYLRLLPPAAGCYPAFPIARGDVPYVDGVEQRLTAMLADQARTHGAVFVDTFTRSLGHDACQPPGMRWVEGTVVITPAAAVHPNAPGMAAVASAVLNTQRAQELTARQRADTKIGRTRDDNQ